MLLPKQIHLADPTYWFEVERNDSLKNSYKSQILIESADFLVHFDQWHQ